VRGATGFSGASHAITPHMNRVSSVKHSKLGRFVAHLLEGVFVVASAMLIGGGILGVWALILARGSELEQMLGGATIGAVWGVLRVTGSKYAVGTAAGAVIGLEIGALSGPFFNAVCLAVLGGCIGLGLHGVILGAKLTTKGLSLKAFVLGPLSAFLGVILGGFAGGLIAAWLCMIFAFGVLPWHSRTIDQGGILVFFVGVLGAIVGAVFGGRCLYHWVVRRLLAPRPGSEAIIQEYEQTKRSQEGKRHSSGGGV
jgi:hypothetical protein